MTATNNAIQSTTVADLETLLAANKLKVVGYRGGAGKFRDIYIGNEELGPDALVNAFVNVRAEMLRRGWHRDFVKVFHNEVDGLLNLEIASFWWE